MVRLKKYFLLCNITYILYILLNIFLWPLLLNLHFIIFMPFRLNLNEVSILAYSFFTVAFQFSLNIHPYCFIFLKLFLLRLRIIFCLFSVCGALDYPLFPLVYRIPFYGSLYVCLFVLLTWPFTIFFAISLLFRNNFLNFKFVSIFCGYFLSLEYSSSFKFLSIFV